MMSGPIFGGVLGFILSHLCSIAGASICYFLSKQLGSSFVEKQMPDKIKWLRNKIEDNRSSLFYYFMFLRITPLVPNWFLNLSSAIVGVPYYIFLTASLVGLIPYTFLLVRTGMTLNDIQSVGFDFNTMLSLTGLSALALLPTFLVKKEDKLM